MVQDLPPSRRGRGGDPRRGIRLAIGVARSALLADLRGVELEATHEVFEDSSFAGPDGLLHDWPDVTIHTTNKGRPENLDATKLGPSRTCAGIAWTLAALPDAEAPRLLALVAASSEARIARSGFSPDRSPRDALLLRRETVERAIGSVRSVAALWPSLDHVAHETARGIRGLAPEVTPESGGDRRVPSRRAEIVGPLGVYYSDYLTDAVGADAVAKAALPGRADGVLAWEAFNLGTRSARSRRSATFDGRYSPVTLSEVVGTSTCGRAKARHVPVARSGVRLLPRKSGPGIPGAAQPRLLEPRGGRAASETRGRRGDRTHRERARPGRRGLARLVRGHRADAREGGRLDRRPSVGDRVFAVDLLVNSVRAYPVSGDQSGRDRSFPGSHPWLLLKPRASSTPGENRNGRSAWTRSRPVDARTRVVAIPGSRSKGWVYPIEVWARLAAKGTPLRVDAIQGLGALPIDVESAGIDVLAADAHKWLLGAESCTVFYVSENARERVPPTNGGWWNVRHDSTHAGGFLDYRLDFHLSARRYEPGSIPTAQIRGLAAALDLIGEMGVETIAARIHDAVEALARGLRDRGWKIVSPEPLGSGILAAAPPDGNPFRAAKAFEAHGVIVAPREGAVRFSPHAYNDAGEVERM